MYLMLGLVTYIFMYPLITSPKRVFICRMKILNGIPDSIKNCSLK